MIIFKIPWIGPSAQEFYVGINRWDRAKLAKKWHADIAMLVSDQKIKPLPAEEYPATIQVNCYFGPGARQYDADNLYAIAKLAIDGLRHAGILINDSPKYIRNLDLIPYRTQEVSHTIIKIFYDDFFSERHRKELSEKELITFTNKLKF